MGGEKVLLVEDVAELRSALATALERAGYVVCGAADGEEGLRAFHSFQPDIALLDILLPGKSGLEVCERIREMSVVPVVILTALAREEEKLVAFEKGADDYIVKGTGLREVVARLGAVLRRAARPAADGVEGRYADGVLTIDFGRQLVWVRGEPADLTPTEYRLLSLLVRQGGRPIAGDELAHRVWGSMYDRKLVGWHIRRVRAKIEEEEDRPRLLVTRRGFGYVYVVPRGGGT